MRAKGVVLSPGVELTKKYGTLKTQKDDKNLVLTYLKLEKHLKPLSRSKSKSKSRSRSKSNEYNVVKGRNKTYKIKNVSKVKSKSNKHDEIIYGKKRTFYVKNK